MKDNIRKALLEKPQSSAATGRAEREHKTPSEQAGEEETCPAHGCCRFHHKPLCVCWLHDPRPSTMPFLSLQSWGWLTGPPFPEEAKFNPDPFWDTPPEPAQPLSRQPRPQPARAAVGSQQSLVSSSQSPALLECRIFSTNLTGQNTPWLCLCWGWTLKWLCWKLDKSWARLQACSAQKTSSHSWTPHCCSSHLQLALRIAPCIMVWLSETRGAASSVIRHIVQLQRSPFQACSTPSKPTSLTAPR